MRDGHSRFSTCPPEGGRYRNQNPAIIRPLQLAGVGFLDIRAKPDRLNRLPKK